jgi:hypothetical protein
MSHQHPATPRSVGKVILRESRNNPTHHLWNNNGTWWIHYSICQSGGVTKRFRNSLKTKDFQTACSRRDKILQDLIFASNAGGVLL